MSWNANAAQPLPAGNTKQMPQSFEQCGAVLADQINRLRDVVHNARGIADRMVGSMPEEKGPPGPKPVGNGYIENLAMELGELEGVINEIHHHHGRISRALSEG